MTGPSRRALNLANELRLAWLTSSAPTDEFFDGPVALQLEALIVERNRAEDCGQAGTCAIGPGCQRHWLERNRELATERAAAVKKLAELVRAVRELEREPRMSGPNFAAIMRLVDQLDPEPEGGS